jgi:hypothetical protein
MEKMVKGLYKNAKEMNAGQVHCEIGEIFGDKDATAVFSIHMGERSSHKILDDLVSWAEANDNQVLLDKIAELSAVK